MPDRGQIDIRRVVNGSSSFVLTKNILDRAGLPTEDITSEDVALWGAFTGVEMLGVVGLEDCNGTGLLRSLAVSVNVRGKGVGVALIAFLLGHARLCGMGELYLLTESASHYFEPLGFEALDRDLAPAAIRRTRQFQSLCQESAVVMRLELSSSVKTARPVETMTLHGSR